MVDRHHAGLDARARSRWRSWPTWSTRRRRGRTAAGWPPSTASSKVLERVDDRERAERLLVHRPCASLRHLGDDRRLEEVALVADALAAGADLAALACRRPRRWPPSPSLRRGLASAPMLRAFVEAVADLERLGVGDELLDEAVVDASPARGSASARCRPGRRCGTCRRQRLRRQRRRRRRRRRSPARGRRAPSSRASCAGRRAPRAACRPASSR